LIAHPWKQKIHASLYRTNASNCESAAAEALANLGKDDVMVPKRKAEILEGIPPKIAARDILDQALRPAEYVVHSRAIRFPFGADQPPD
jgi:hypothetical protein